MSGAIPTDRSSTGAEDRPATDCPEPGLSSATPASALIWRSAWLCTTRMTASTTRRDGIESFVSGIRGAVLRPEDPGY